MSGRTADGKEASSTTRVSSFPPAAVVVPRVRVMERVFQDQARVKERSLILQYAVTAFPVASLREE